MILSSFNNFFTGISARIKPFFYFSKTHSEKVISVLI